MKVVILAGGHGTRLSEETVSMPKPMVKIGEFPILWHIMKIYSHYGFNEFIVLLGYKGYLIKEYFNNYLLHKSNVTIDLQRSSMSVLEHSCEPWKITLIETGLNTLTGGRIKQAERFIGEEPFMLTYGDGVADVDIRALTEFHQSHGGAITMTTVQPEGQFGVLNFDGMNQVSEFIEKPRGDQAWINAGFFVCEPRVLSYLDNAEQIAFEKAPMERLAAAGELFAYKHFGFWKCMDTKRDNIQLNEMWDSEPKWKIWEE